MGMRGTVKRLHLLLHCAVMCVAVSFIAVAGAHAQTQEEADFFESKIRPIFAEKCSVCHGEEMQMAELQLNTAKGFFKGANSGPVVVPGDPAASRLIPGRQLPGKNQDASDRKLPGEQIEVLTEWVRMGAPWPNAELEKLRSRPCKEGRADRNQTEHWAFQPVRDQEPPQVENRTGFRIHRQFHPGETRRKRTQTRTGREPADAASSRQFESAWAATQRAGDRGVSIRHREGSLRQAH